VWERLRRHLYSHLAAVTVLTGESAVWLKAHTYARRVPIIPNAVVWPLPIQSPRLDPVSVGIPGRKRLLAVGRLVSQKGFDWLITAFAMLAERYPSWELVILGEGPLRPALQAQVDAADLQQRVFLPGRVGNVGQWYEYADLYVMSSRFEGFPNTLVEALAHGLPAVSFDCDTGPRDIIRHEVDGLLVPLGDVAALTADLERVMGDVNLRLRLATRAVEARERFSMERIAGMWEALFKELSQ
jgi:glycosyltransferase involved in cell wall biosynthesis